ncbi:hypothetical protein [Mycoplasmopsis columbina]|uniref:hypothetical protein n=1 Tax=Mycoplasmopsis columbina TaxID=114881 RepID=UPI0004A786D8|nr:hypothetical protein [Mycoplasmopsis columbina]VEU76937.1 Uncharacterised protein [Mycoplasmopsis columbina]
MESIIENLKNKIKKDQKKLKLYNFWERILSILITILNIVVISIAIYTLTYLFKIRETNKSDSVFVIIFILVFFMVSSFFLNIFLEIYKTNSRYREYKKIKNTLYYLTTKYKSKLISEDDLEHFADLLWTKATTKKKIIIKDIIIDQLKKGN